MGAGLSFKPQISPEHILEIQLEPLKCFESQLLIRNGNVKLLSPNNKLITRHFREI